MLSTFDSPRRTIFLPVGDELNILLNIINKIIFSPRKHHISYSERHQRDKNAHCSNAEARERPVVNWTPETFDKIVHWVLFDKNMNVLSQFEMTIRGWSKLA